jgi:hypothetical protein
LYTLVNAWLQGGLGQNIIDEDTKEYDDEEMYNDVDQAEPIEEDPQDEELRASITLFLEDLCEDKNLLTRESVEKLKALVDSRDERLLAAFDLFSDERDLEDLVDTLQRLAEKVVIVGEDEDGDLDEADEDDGEADEEHDAISLFDIVNSMGLSLTYLEIIRDAMEIRHPQVEKAIDSFAKTQDQEAFKRDLVSFCESQL